MNQQRLSDAELERLFARLDVTQDWAVGFFAAVASGPDVIEPKQWLPFVVREGALDGDEALAHLATLTKVHDAVSLSLRLDPRDVTPDAKDTEGVRDFASGYLRGARLHPTWRGEGLEGLAALVGEEDGSPLAPAELPELVASMRARWKKREPAVSTKVARNDPCPCGSGKKFKKCCARP